MGKVSSQITSLTIVYSTVYSGAQRKHQSSASLAFVRGIHRGPVNSPHKWPVTHKMLPFDDVIMAFAMLRIRIHLSHCFFVSEGLCCSVVCYRSVLCHYISPPKINIWLLNHKVKYNHIYVTQLTLNCRPSCTLKIIFWFDRKTLILLHVLRYTRRKCKLFQYKTISIHGRKVILQ